MNEIEIYEAISYMKEMRSICDTDSGVVPQSYDMALSALREKAERAKGCEYCHGWDKRCGVNYCPDCGKELKEVQA